MKTIFQTILFLISIVTFSQEKLTGKYCLTFGEGDATCIDFKENNRFDYVKSGCLGIIEIGSGKFELKNKNLNLIFDKTEQVSKRKIKITDIKTENEKEINLTFNIKDENGNELPANIIRPLADRKYFFYDEPNKTFIVYKNSPNAKYSVELMGYETIEIGINHTNDKKISVIMPLERAEIISDTTRTIKLNKFIDNGFKKNITPWDTYKKVKKTIGNNTYK